MISITTGHIKMMRTFFEEKAEQEDNPDRKAGYLQGIEEFSELAISQIRNQMEMEVEANV